MKRGKNLILVAEPRVSRRETFEEVARLVTEIADDVHPIVLVPDEVGVLTRFCIPRRPTLIFSATRVPRPVRKLKGVVDQGGVLGKREELERLDRAGLPVPRWAALTREVMPDLSDFGPYVVVKPNYGRKGAQVKIKRKGRVRWKLPETEHPSRHENFWIVQEFIFTGHWPISYRVTSLYGRALWSYRAEADHRRRPLPSRYDFRPPGVQGGGVSIVASAIGSTVTLNNDPEIIALGERAHEAFPDRPLLGVDIIREEPGGKLQILEVNASGYTLHFSSPMGSAMQEYAGIDFASQFDGLRRMAKVLVRVTRERAR
jgi:hypothetical protein